MSSAKPIPFPHKKYGTWYIEEDLRDAAYRGDLSRIQVLLAQYPTINLNATNEYNETALYIACKKNQYTVVEFLLRNPQVDVNISTLLGNSPALISTWNDNNELTEKLLVRGADINARTNANRDYHGGVSALDIAEERNNTTLISYLRNHPEIDLTTKPAPISPRNCV